MTPTIAIYLHLLEGFLDLFRPLLPRFKPEIGAFRLQKALEKSRGASSQPLRRVLACPTEVERSMVLAKQHRSLAPEISAWNAGSNHLGRVTALVAADSDLFRAL